MDLEVIPEACDNIIQVILGYTLCTRNFDVTEIFDQFFVFFFSIFCSLIPIDELKTFPHVEYPGKRFERIFGFSKFWDQNEKIVRVLTKSKLNPN